MYFKQYLVLLLIFVCKNTFSEDFKDNGNVHNEDCGNVLVDRFNKLPFDATPFTIDSILESIGFTRCTTFDASNKFTIGPYTKCTSEDIKFGVLFRWGWTVSKNDDSAGIDFFTYYFENETECNCTMEKIRKLKFELTKPKKIEGCAIYSRPGAQFGYRIDVMDECALELRLSIHRVKVN